LSDQLLLENALVSEVGHGLTEYLQIWLTFPQVTGFFIGYTNLKDEDPGEENPSLGH
jgi:hypothetical protein